MGRHRDRRGRRIFSSSSTSAAPSRAKNLFPDRRIARQLSHRTVKRAPASPAAAVVACTACLPPFLSHSHSCRTPATDAEHCVLPVLLLLSSSKGVEVSRVDAGGEDTSEGGRERQRTPRTLARSFRSFFRTRDGRRPTDGRTDAAAASAVTLLERGRLL